MKKKNSIMKKLSLILVLYSIIGCLFGCIQEKEIQSKNYNFISLKEEQSIGREISKQITEKYGVYKDPKLTKYVNNISKKITQLGDDESRDCKTIILDDSSVRIFSIIGSTIFITRGYLAELNSEAELCFVLGREIAHLNKKHGEKRMSDKQIDISVLAAGLMASKNRLKKEWEVLIQKLVEQIYKGYSQESEVIADKEALSYLMNLGYDPRDALKMLTIFSRDYLGENIEEIKKYMLNNRKREKTLEQILNKKQLNQKLND